MVAGEGRGSTIEARGGDRPMGAGSYLSVEERRASGEEARRRSDPGEHAEWQPPPSRPDPVSLLDAQNATRDPDLVPLRHARMVQSPFTFFRGAATIMASDLAGVATTDLQVQLCGDAHLSNFGAYASPERRLVFDLNDFDETLPGPFEHDVRRLATSVMIAAQNNGFTEDEGRQATRAAARGYRKAMTGFAEMPTMEVWYSSISEDDLRADLKELRRQRHAALSKESKQVRQAEARTLAEGAKRGNAALRKARGRTSLQALSKLTEVVGGERRIISNPPSLIPMRELGAVYGFDTDGIDAAVHQQFAGYLSTLADSHRHLLGRFRIVDVARKVVGVGSVGTRAFVALLQGRDDGDPLFLQVKEATRSVLEAHLPPTGYATPGERVVRGQRLMQATSDIFLGWTTGVEQDRYFYWRQLRDMKASADVEEMLPPGMEYYAGLCGWTLARAHARSGDPVAIAACLRKSFDTALTGFAAGYAAQNTLDYTAFRDAISSGRLEASPTP
jgi:uncharacterized protein (DUF2252 family)